jgi:DNA-binding transcriptional ArsR family regulator
VSAHTRVSAAPFTRVSAARTEPAGQLPSLGGAESRLGRAGNPSHRRLDEQCRETTVLVLICKRLLAYGAPVGDVFRALADPTRRTILDELTERNGQTLFEICARLLTNHGLGSSRQAISQHLDVLEAAGLVETRREGRYKFHYINTAPLEPIVARWLRGADKHGGRPATAPTQTGAGNRHEDQPDERAGR